MEVINAKGLNGTVSFDGQFVTIVTTTKEEKRIPVSQISEVRFRAADASMFGYSPVGFIQFIFPGVEEQEVPRSGIMSLKDISKGNVITHNKKHLSAMEAIRDAVEQAIMKLREHPVSSSGVGDLTRLVELHAQGVLTDEEFAAAKARALGL